MAAEAEVGGAALAKRVVTALYERDNASKSLGMKIEGTGPGTARVSMRVRSDMLNGHRTCHGGFIFALADSAFAFACNSRNEAAVAAACHIDYLEPSHEGDVLLAEAVEQALAGRAGVYEITITNQAGRTVALFRGKSIQLRREVLAVDEPVAEESSHAGP